VSIALPVFENRTKEQKRLLACDRQGGSLRPHEKPREGEPARAEMPCHSGLESSASPRLDVQTSALWRHGGVRATPNWPCTEVSYVVGAPPAIFC